jgi:tetratricopeptide (TPR) repeat protein
MNRALLGRLTLGPGTATAAEPGVPSARPGRQWLEANPALRVALARLALKHGKAELARQTLADLAANGCSKVPRDLGYLHTLCRLALLAIDLRDRSAAEHLLELLAPYAHFNTPSVLRVYDGPVAYFSARVAAFLGDEHAADRYFAQALEIDERLELWPLLAIACFEYARWSLRTGRAAQADALRTKALDLAGSLGMSWLVQKARELTAR